jgi:cellulose synthase/poly-beta-1,6-N-acetylglucosamine synthase-like glycosyltransferase
MAKAFESLFGSVTCLPGCFTLYRMRAPDTHKPLFISSGLIQDYSENRVDTLHMKNLLHLGEDRYLTTLLLKHFPNYKTMFVRDAHAYTVAPDDWKILLSQRRRWINSTVHNLGELAFLEQLCGFCCFSMRFVVMIDLVSTLIQPVTVAYVSFFRWIELTLESYWTFSDRLSSLFDSWCTPDNSYRVSHFDWGSIRPASACVHLARQVGHGRLDDFLYPCDPRVLLYAPALFFLENG